MTIRFDNHRNGTENASCHSDPGRDSHLPPVMPVYEDCQLITVLSNIDCPILLLTRRYAASDAGIQPPVSSTVLRGKTEERKEGKKNERMNE